MHAGILVARPLTALGATLPIAQYDGNTAVSINVDRKKETEINLRQNTKSENVRWVGEMA